jgi:hypothetical protein
MPATLQEWTEKLTSQAFPVLQSTIDSLNALFADEGVSYRQLSSVVLSDPGMVVNSIQAANLDQGHRLHQSIQTVDHAFMKLGMERSAQLHKNLPILEELLNNQTETVRRHIMGVYERSHHAAYQAMDLLRRMGEIEPGEVYIATFLTGLGEILVWLNEPEIANQVRGYMRNNEVAPEEAEQAVLGFTYAQLTQAMVEKMEFSPLLVQLLGREDIDSPRCLGILLGLRLAFLAERGWYREEMVPCLGDIAEFLRQPLEVTISIVHSNAATAARHYQYGVPAAAALLPILDDGSAARTLEETAERVAKIEFPTLISHQQLDYILELSRQPEFDYEMSLVEPGRPQQPGHEFAVKQPIKEGYDTELIISADEDGDDTYIISFEERDKHMEQEGICPVPDEHSLEDTIDHLTQQIDQSISMPEIMKLVMEGMHDGLGLTRVAFTMLTPDRKMLKTRAVMSVDDDWDIRHLHIPLEPDNLFSHIMSRPQALWLSDENVDKIWPHVPKDLVSVLHKDGFFAMSIYVKNRPVGLFYADRYNHEHRLNERCYENFKQLCRHASKAMLELSRH